MGGNCLKMILLLLSTHLERLSGPMYANQIASIFIDILSTETCIFGFIHSDKKTEKGQIVKIVQAFEEMLPKF